MEVRDTVLALPVNADTPASKHLKVLSIRLPDPEVRRFKCLAASRGISLQEAVHQALETWASEIQKTALEPLDALEGFTRPCGYRKPHEVRKGNRAGQREPLALKCRVCSGRWAIMP